MKIFVETEHLLLRELHPSDAAGMYALDSDPEVHRYLGNQPLTDPAKVPGIIDYVRQQYLDNGIGRWAVEEKATGVFVGWAGLKFVREPMGGRVDFYDVGYRLIREYWGKGYATEASRASVAYGLEEMKLPEIFGAAHVDNIGSRRVLEKSGLTFVDYFTDEDGEPFTWYHIGHASVLKVMV